MVSANPFAITFTVYLPRFRASMRYSPLDPVVVERTSPPSAADAFTVAPGTTRPCASVTTPAMVPFVVCANSVPPTASANTTSRASTYFDFDEIFIRPPPSPSGVMTSANSSTAAVGKITRRCVPAGSALTTRCETLHGLCKAVGAAPATQGWQLGLPQKCDRRHNRDKCTGLLPDLGIAEKGIHESIWEEASGNRNVKRRKEGRT